MRMEMEFHRDTDCGWDCDHHLNIEIGRPLVIGY